MYAPVKEFAGNLAYISGCGPQNGNKNTYIGKLGQELTLEQGQAAARNAILNGWLCLTETLVILTG